MQITRREPLSLAEDKLLHKLPEDGLLVEYEKFVLEVARRRVIKFLYPSERPIAIKTILEKTNISLNSLVAVYSELNKEDYMCKSADGLVLTNKGKLWALKNRKSIFMRKIVPTYNKPKKTETQSKLKEFRKLPDTYVISWVDTKITKR